MSTSVKTVFLAGSAGSTTWRKDISVPMLQQHNVRYYNPQVDDWSPDLIPIENAEKQAAHVLLFVIDSATRSVMSMLEMVEYITTAMQHVVVCIEDIPDNHTIEGYVLNPREISDLNRGRAYARDICERYGVPLSDSIAGATLVAIGLCK